MVFPDFPSYNIESLGCWNDQGSTGGTALMNIERLHPALMDSPATRPYPMNKCLKAAKDLGIYNYPRLSHIYTIKRSLVFTNLPYKTATGYQTFGLQNGGECVVSANEERSYDMFGPSDNCRSDGKGGHLSNELYQIQFHGRCKFYVMESFCCRKTAIKRV